ncbi:MAG: hypothetical protein L0216_12130 [Planctomycetales bacterium]|nr:hypothetical protein [Planctomycetales bacterium]
MNLAVRIALLFGAMLLLTIVVVPPWGFATQSGPVEFVKFAPLWSPPVQRCIVVGYLFAELAGVLLATALVVAGLWNLPRSRTDA